MAGPDQSAPPPESVMLQSFTGIKNTVSRERLTAAELEKALNVDLDDVGQVRRRRGYTLKASGDWHSLFTSTRGVFGVKDGTLVSVYPSGSSASLGFFCGSDPLTYVEVGSTIYFVSRAVSGKIQSDNTVAAWGGVGGDGLWLSPVVNPVADQLPALRGKLLGSPPFATCAAYYNGRIYLGHGRTIWATELYLYDYVDRTRTFWHFEDEVTDIGAVTDGLYVGTQSAVYYISGPTFDKMVRIPVMNYGMLPGSLIAIPAELLVPQQQKPGMASKNAVIFMTTSGLAAGFDNGVCNNLSQNTTIFPNSQQVAALFRRQDGANHYVGVMDSGGSPAANTRIGDYVDAEIRRFQGA